MGRSNNNNSKKGNYCFKIIACGGGSSKSESSSAAIDTHDLLHTSQNKGSDKKGWSFRKKDRVLSNTVITEFPASENKVSEPVIIHSETPVVSEKAAAADPWTEELPRGSTSTAKGSAVSKEKATDDHDIPSDSTIDEAVVIVIQAAVRKFLAQRELLRHKNVVKLQAAVRGHLVRCRAAGTLRCIQSIVKMQILVRARIAKPSVAKKGIQDSRYKPQPTYISIEKLLSNRFAIQVLNSTPRTKQINIKCDTSKDDPSWKWMERWMSISSPEVMESHTSKHEHDKVDDNKSKDGNVNVEHKSDLEIEPTLLPKNPAVEVEQPKRLSKRMATEQADSEGRKSVFGSRKASNPSFLAAHSRFEGLTSKTNSLTSVSSSNQENALDSPVHKSVKVESAKSYGYESLRVGRSHTGGSECGTELSITSLLDSPDPSEAGNTENVKDSKVLDKAVNYEEHDLLGTELTHSFLDLSENYDGNCLPSSEPSKPEDNADILSQLNQNGSPRSHITASELQRTPSSQLSVKSKTRTDKKASGQKPKSWSNSQKSPVSFDHLPRETKHGKRRNSFGSQTSDLMDQEPRDSSSSNSIPSYMQVTESARAKALANSSPRSSPDVQGKEAYLKKRHSLPAAVNGRHSSPRVKRSSPQAQQTTKGNDNRERKWQN
uniref:protein IQ-DOMAIN 32-like isoform X2 n=1 Tax=Erigeron canadensis TaxID=72917 RepID=UPI001CB94B71|nr:protein IQ-DOMAIN 32-like isoform X2 [Erigeron canadensis]